jgi:hypothetical protein
VSESHRCQVRARIPGPNILARGFAGLHETQPEKLVA